jgi:hypothetical protein
MPTQNPRINITVDESIASLLASLADQEHTSISNITKELVLEALERREDIALSAIANIRDTKQAKRIKHSDVWK